MAKNAKESENLTTKMSKEVKKCVNKLKAAKSAMTRNINALTKLCDEWSNLQEDREICSTTLRRLAEEIQAHRVTVKQNLRDLITAGDNLIEAVTDEDTIDETATEKSIKDVNQ